MNKIVPIQPIYQRVLVRAVYRHRVHYRPLVIECTIVAPTFSYKTLMELLNVYVEEDWMVGGTGEYPHALKLLEQKVASIKKPVLPGYFITVWPSSELISVAALFKDAAEAS